MATQQSQLNAIITADITQYNQQLDASVKKLEQTAKAFDKIGSNLTLKLTTPLSALAALIIKISSEVEEMSNRFDVVFGASADGVREWSNSLSDSVNRSRYDIENYVSSYNILLKSTGLASKVTEDFSKSLTQLNIDLASFYDKTDAEVMVNLKSGLVGEAEAVRRFGIDISEAALKYELANSKIGKSWEELQQGEKIQLRLNKILKDTAIVTGDAERTSGSFANQVKGLQGNLKDLAVEFGEVLLPIATDFVGKSSEWVKSFKGLDLATKELIVKMAALLASLGPLALAISGVIKFVILLKNAMIALNNAAMYTNPALFAIAGVLAAGTAAWINYASAVKQAEDNMVRVNELSIGDNWKAEEDMARQLATQLDVLNQKGRELGIAFNIQTDKYGVSFLVDNVKSLEQVAGELGITTKQAQEARDSFLNDGRKFSSVVQSNYTSFENLQKAIKAVNSGIKEHNEETIIATRTEANLLAISKAYGEEQRATISRYTNAINSQIQYRKSVNDVANTFKQLTAKEKLNAEEKQQLVLLQEFLNNQFGESATVMAKNAAGVKLNENALNKFNNKIADTIALTRNKVVLKIETQITAGKQDVATLEQDRNKLASQILKTRDLEEKESLKRRLVEVNKYLASVKANIIENEAFKVENAAKTVEDIQKQLDEQFKSEKKAAGKSAEEIAAEREAALRDSINAEISLLNFKYNTEQIQSNKLLEGLKANLKKYSTFYKKNLSEELALRERIYQIEQEIEKKNLEKQEDALKKANDNVTKQLKDRQALLEKTHKETLTRIEKEKDAKIKAIEDEIDAQERLLNNTRLQDRVKEINAVIDAYRQSTTAEGQSRFKELLEERQDIELKLRKDTADAQIKIIEANADAAKTAEEKRFEQQNSLLEKQITAVESSYTKMLNNLQGITDKVLAETQKTIDIFAKKLQESYKNIKAEEIKPGVIRKTGELSVAVPTLNAAALPNVNLTQPGAVSGAINNITNNVTVNNNFSITGTNLTAQEISQQIANQINISIKEVL